MKYDCIVVGGGHAGCEAAHITAFMGKKTLLITMNINNIADMPCNPSIGGTAKGVIVRDIDALGGLMGRIADQSHFQMKMLNSKKGPAVRCLRCQADKITYPKNMLNALQNTPNLEIKEGMVEDLLTEENKIKGIVLSNQEKIEGETLILTTGTYLKSNILRGDKNIEGGPHGEARSNFLSDNLKRLGFTIQRLKTGTPPRIKASSIDFSKMQEEHGDELPYSFSHDLAPIYNPKEQQKCYLLYTNETTHKLILDNLDKSSMYGGYVTGIGPRYCPSIEDKIVRFNDKERHQLFLEPESLSYDEWYLQGFSTSMPEEIQEKMVHSLSGLENAKITKYAYAIEYDAIDPLELKPSLETKIIENLFTAGQINGTSGYEEAAGQGLLAGINAVQKLRGQEPLILKRNESYLGVLIDDLVTKGTKEPYRMLTSRAEYRLILRHDNALLRLRKYGYHLGTITEEMWVTYQKVEKEIKALNDFLKETKLEINEDVKKEFESHHFSIPLNKTTLFDLLKRPEITIDFLSHFLTFPFSNDIKEIVSIEIKYEGYIKKTEKEIEKMLKLEEKQIPKDIDYQNVKNLASEARQKLEIVRPLTLAQASRISGVNPSDLSILAIYLKKEYGKNE
ncbi:MAG: tRNA uridine-5-carboxymethylaminomethyl(34) synthesis enzyme MnmG [Bacilli bacterium]|jgi:tRNA uridine 5-carboxymethylaminomethyl modification enzyme|nr:tRNA uridine-5-carboxymethylaminomethyl(34) synthesis enzyme MnmG [Bacilli bacterium]